MLTRSSHPSVGTKVRPMDQPDKSFRGGVVKEIIDNKTVMVDWRDGRGIRSECTDFLSWREVAIVLNDIELNVLRQALGLRSEHGYEWPSSEQDRRAMLVRIDGARPHDPEQSGMYNCKIGAGELDEIVSALSIAADEKRKEAARRHMAGPRLKDARATLRGAADYFRHMISDINNNRGAA